MAIINLFGASGHAKVVMDIIKAQGDEVIVQSFTFCASSHPITYLMEIANRYEIPVIEDAAEGLGSRYNGRVLGTFGKYGVLSFNGNKMITTSGGGALVCDNAEEKNKVMWYATQARESSPYYQHETIGYNYRMSNICAGIGRGQMTVINDHIAHHKHVQALYEELLKSFASLISARGRSALQVTWVRWVSLSFIWQCRQ